MKISGFSFARNADTLYYPLVESIRSILPICDEFVIAVGKGSAGDRTRELICSIGDPRIRILDTVWDEVVRPGRHVFAEQTNLALSNCIGDWCFYLQSDEVVHERYLPVVRDFCSKHLSNRQVEGMLFHYRHFWGDYRHFLVSHAWYPKEIRLVRNGVGVRSHRDAQSFRIGPHKLRVVQLPAEVFHYGWVRPPHLMQTKVTSMRKTYWQCRKDVPKLEKPRVDFDYGSLAKLPVYTGTHPEVMQAWIQKMDWGDRLVQSGVSPTKHKHDRLKYRMLTFIEQKLLGGRPLGGFKNYRLLD